jgi:hypothetical protein
VLARTSPDGVPASSTTDIRSADAAHPDGTYHLEPLPEDVAALPMIGDVNLFLKGTPPATPWVPDTTKDLADEGVPGRSELQNTKDDDPPFEAEVEVMIAGIVHPPSTTTECLLNLANSQSQRSGRRVTRTKCSRSS